MSATQAKHRAKGHFLLQLLIFIFGMNTALSSAACCLDLRTTNTNGEASISSAVAELPPCHQKAQQKSLQKSDSTPQEQFSEIDSIKNCCSACVIAIAPTATALSLQTILAGDYSVPAPVYLFKNIQTPYRPPASHLA